MATYGKKNNKRSNVDNMNLPNPKGLAEYNRRKELRRRQRAAMGIKRITPNNMDIENDNLDAARGRYVDLNGNPYEGKYHIHKDGRIMSESTHIVGSSKILLPAELYKTNPGMFKILRQKGLDSLYGGSSVDEITGVGPKTNKKSKRAKRVKRNLSGRDLIERNQKKDIDYR